MRFGKPYIEVVEGNAESKSERLRRRRVFVGGEFLLWFEMCEWEYFENGKCRFNSGQSRAQLRRLAARLQSQALTAVQLEKLPPEMSFDFDLGGQIRVRPAPAAEEDDALWHLYTSDKCLTMFADGRLQHGLSKSLKLGSLMARPETYILKSKA